MSAVSRKGPRRPVPASPPRRGEPDPPGPETNAILGGLSSRTRASVMRIMDEVEMRAGDTVYLPREPIEHVYFPLGSVISVLSLLPMEGDAAEAEAGINDEERDERVAARGELRATGGGPRSIEVGTIGTTGFAGISLVLEGESSSFLVLCEVPGRALRLPAADFRRHFQRSGEFRELCLSAARGFFTQMGRNTACNAAHPLEQRCARWILIAADHSGSELVRLTHHVLSQMLGVRRAGVTVALGELARRGMIRISRGRIMILDRRALEAAACSCYRLIRRDESREVGR